MEVDIISGFFGTGKTTFINKYLSCFDEKLAIIENEFGDIGLDAKLINEGIKVKELNSGCICCTLQGDFRGAINEIYRNNLADKIIIEPSGISKLSYVSAVCDQAKKFDKIDITLGKRIVIVDSMSFIENLEDFGVFYTDQISYADVIFLTNVSEVENSLLFVIKEEIKELNNRAIICFEDFRKMSQEELINIINNSYSNNMFDILESDNEYPADLSSLTIILNEKFNDSKLKELEKNITSGEFGNIIRAKGILNSYNSNEKWHFDYTLSGFKVELLNDEKIINAKSRIIFIGKNLNSDKIKNFNGIKD